MDEFIGKYHHVKSENLDAYFKSVGVPYAVRIMMGRSNPDLEIVKNGEEWKITTKSLLRSAEKKFTLGSEYEEQMPGKTLKSKTIFEEGKIITNALSEDGVGSRTIYELKGDELIMALTHLESGNEAKRIFKRTT